MAVAAARKAALGGPRPNPSGDIPRKLASPPGKGKPVALANITNTGRPNAIRSLSVGEVVKENVKLVQLINEKTRIIEVSRVEMQKLHLALQASRQQNVQLVQANSQMLMVTEQTLVEVFSTYGQNDKDEKVTATCIRFLLCVHMLKMSIYSLRSPLMSE